MNKKNKVYFVVALILFFIGDLAVTYYGLQNGAKETNIIFRETGFVGIIISKLLFFIIAYFFVNKLERSKHEYEIGIIVGSIIVMGLITILVNIGFYQKL